MKFSEKLIKLRKEKLLSQEELGEKLNVTRQTVSKWELGQTTPDMDKLLEMSKIFGVTLDELTSDSDLNNNDAINNGGNYSKRNIIIAIVLIIVLFGAVGAVTNRVVTNKRATNKITGNVIGLFTRVFDRIADSIDSDKWDIDSFNSPFNLYIGTQSGSRVQGLIDRVVTNNKTTDRLITIEYNDVSTTDSNELINLKRNFDNAFNKFEVSFDYGDEGYIFKVNISDISENNLISDAQNQIDMIKQEYESFSNESDKKSFNRTFEIRGGTKRGAAVQWLIDDVIQNNQTNDRLVMVKYNDTKTSDPAELRALKRNFDEPFIDYEVYFEYGEDGYIYEAVIEKI